MCQAVDGDEDFETHFSSGFYRVAASIATLTNVHTLAIYKVAASIAMLTNIHTLAILSCTIMELPVSIGALNNLTERSISQCALSNVSSSFESFTVIRALELENLLTQTFSYMISFNNSFSPIM